MTTAASTVQGIDVSSGQHPNGAAIDWNGVALAGYKFAFIKVGEGSYYVNPYYASDAAEAQAAGVLAAPYEFAIPNYSGGALQADYALDHAQYAPDGQMLAPILDIEGDPYDSSRSQGGDGTNECYGLTPAQMVAWVGAFTTEIHRRTGQSPAIYTSTQFWDLCTGDSAAFTSDPLWLVAQGSTPSTPPAAWSNWTYWQYTSGASSSAVPTKFDASWLSSTALELAAPASQSDQAGRSASLGVRSLDGGTAATYSATGLPTGLQIDSSNGAVSGTLPASAASFPVSITATAGAQQATAKLQLVRPFQGPPRRGEQADGVGCGSDPVAGPRHRRPARLHAPVLSQQTASWPDHQQLRDHLRVAHDERLRYRCGAGDRRFQPGLLPVADRQRERKRSGRADPAEPRQVPRRAQRDRHRHRDV